MNKTRLLDCNQLLDIFSASHVATAIYTTEDLVIEAVTDAMLAFWGKSRSVIGMPIELAVPELVGQPFIQQMRDVITTGHNFLGQNVPAQLQIDGRLQTRYYNYEYRALKNANGQIYAMLHTATDVTEKVLGEQAIAHEQQHLLNIANEQALNEELAAANEELSAVNAELQQTYEQLSELNTELESRILARTSQLASSEARMRYMIDDAPVAIAVLNGQDFVVEQANQYTLKIWGKTADVIGKTIYEALPEMEGQGFFELLKDVFASGKAFAGTETPGNVEYNGELKQIYTDFVFKPLKGDDGQTHSIMIVASEVTDKVHARQAIEAARHRVEAMVKTTPVAMTILHSRDLIIEIANDAMYGIWQRTEEETSGKRLIDVFPELIGQPFPDLLANVFDTGNSIAFPEMPVNIRLTDGTDKNIFVNFSYDPILNPAGQVESILASVIDVSESVCARQALERSEHQLQEAMEELAASNEELTAINEEMLASNEELAATNEELVSTQDHLHDTIEQLEESRERIDFLLNSMPQQVWTANPDGQLDYVNDVVAREFGLDKATIIGSGWQQLIHPNDLPQVMERWLHALENGNEYLVQFRLKLNHGRYEWYLGRAVPLIEQGKVKMWLGTSTNIHLQKTNEEKKDEFLSIASHELRTPLTTIKAFNQLMARCSDVDKFSGFVKKSADHIYRLEKLIADLLDVTRLSAGKLEYNMQSFSFKQLLTESVDNIKHMAPNHEIMLKNAIELDFTGDYFRLEQVMNNFLSNAVKYSPKGEKVVVDSKLEQDQLVVSVQDFGIGIEPSHINKLFDRYYRVDNTAMRFEGLGLGLFISSEILKRHQGKVWIESEVGKGSTFYFSIPIVQELVDTNSINVDLGTSMTAAN